MKKILLLCAIALFVSCANDSIESKIKSRESYKRSIFSSSYEMVDFQIDSAFMCPMYDSLSRVYAGKCSEYNDRTYSLDGDNPIDSLSLYKGLLMDRAQQLSGEFIGWVAEHRYMYTDIESSYDGRLSIVVYDSLAQKRILSYDGLREYGTDDYITEMFGKREKPDTTKQDIEKEFRKMLILGIALLLCIVCVWVFLCFLAARIGVRRQCRFWLIFLISLILSPITGLLLAFLLGKSKRMILQEQILTEQKRTNELLEKQLKDS